MLPLHAAEPAHIYAALFSGKISFVIDDGEAAVLKRIRVSRFGMMRFLRRHLESKRKEPITLPAAARVLGLPESEMPKLINAGLLAPLPWQHRTPAFDGNQVWLLLDKFAISSRWCRKRNLRYLTTCRNIAKSTANSPVVGEYLYRKESGIYNLLRRRL